MSYPMRVLGALSLVSALAACDSSSPASTGSQAQLNVATRPAAAGVAAAPAMAMGLAPVVFGSGADTLVITQVQMVVREVELKRSDVPAGCTGGTDGCEELESGPYLLDLPLTGGASTVVAVDVTPGTYDELEFKVRKPEGDSGFITQHPEFSGVSIRVIGTWNGTPFPYTTDVSAEQELNIAPPLVITETASADFTLMIDIGTWFRDAGGALVDPSTANVGGPNESRVNSNITQSFDAFEDENHDGTDDHGGK
jgi:hypothetical protein